MVTLRAWERLERFIKWEHKKKYGRMPSEEELKKVHYPATIFMFRRPCAPASPRLSYAS
jgi:hypothetical protein